MKISNKNLSMPTKRVLHILIVFSSRSNLLFDIMQSQLSENVLPVTSQHLAVGRHCIDMLLQKDAVAAGAGSPKKRAPPKASGKSKSPGAKKGQ